MKLAVEWKRPIALKLDRDNGLIYNFNWELLPRSSGIYIFARKWSKSYEALYVGKTNNLRSRTRNHLNNLKLMTHLREAKNGHRVLIVGTPITKSGQRIDKVVTLLERTLIRHFLAEGHDLVNQQGVRIRRHEIESSGGVPKAFIPSLMYLNRSKGD